MITPAQQKLIEAAHADFVALFKKHAAHLDSTVLLSLQANLLGKTLAMQDQRRPVDVYFALIATNIELGNKEMLEELLASKGNA